MPFERPVTLQQRMKTRPVCGPINLIPSTLIVEQLCAMPFDFIWTDMEHGPQTMHDIGAAVSICIARGICPIVRVPCAEDWAVKWVLDQGAMGIIFPFINTVEEARRAISACRYPPVGHRGYFPDVAANRWGLDNAAYVTQANADVCVILQIEHDDAVRNVEQIAALPGWDMLFIGPMDLSASYGKLGQLDDPQVSGAIDRALRAAHAAGRFAGILAATPDQAKLRLDQGFDFLGLMPDIGIVSGAIRRYWDEVQAAVKG